MVAQVRERTLRANLGGSCNSYCRIFYSFVVRDAIQPTMPNAGTTNGKMPYSVSLTEWERRSTAIKTLTQKMAPRATTIHPCTQPADTPNPTSETTASSCLLREDFRSVSGNTPLRESAFGTSFGAYATSSPAHASIASSSRSADLRLLICGSAIRAKARYGVISNTTPKLLLPPYRAVPYIFPDEVLIRPAKGSDPSVQFVSSQKFFNTFTFPEASILNTLPL